MSVATFAIVSGSVPAPLGAPLSSARTISAGWPEPSLVTLVADSRAANTFFHFEGESRPTDSMKTVTSAVFGP